jgi:hypothetical protein
MILFYFNPYIERLYTMNIANDELIQSIHKYCCSTLTINQIDTQIALSTRDIKSAVETYNTIKQAENESYVQFGSDGGGYTGYYYYKHQHIVYAFRTSMQKINGFYLITDKWVNNNQTFYNRLFSEAPNPY